MKAHIIENNLVVNTIEVNSLSDFPNLVDGSTGGIGWSYLNNALVAPPVTPKTDVELAANAREKRDKLLAATDWVVLRAKELGQPVPLDVYTYRGDLRQIPEQVGFPETITWPELEA
tara:strand:- start:209 stop:559 length:351 start_codon:yes stop_codon:yes gene_type:complete